MSRSVKTSHAPEADGRRFLLASFSFSFALSYTLSLPRVGWWFLSYFAVYALLEVIWRAENRHEAFSFSCLAGFLFFLFSIFWVRHVTWCGLITYALISSASFGAFGFFSKHMLQQLASVHKKRRVSYKTLFLVWTGIPALWVLNEYARVNIPVIGFGFNLLGHTHTPLSTFIQAARIFGVYGVSYCIAFMGTSIFLVKLGQKEKKQAIRLTENQLLYVGAITGILILSIIFYGRHRLAQPSEQGRMLRVGVIQGNIEQHDKWAAELKPLIIEKYKKLTQLAKFEGPDLLVWPEAAWPGYFNADYESAQFQNFIDELAAPLVVGAPRLEWTQGLKQKAYNSAFLVMPGEGVTDVYDKIFLVPFGEYIPFGGLFRLFGIEQYAKAMGVSDFSFGNSPDALLRVDHKSRAGEKGGYALGMLICFEDGFPSFSRRLVREGAEFLAVITNDAWFERSAAAYQHLQCSIFRALETGRYVIRAANTGISSFVNPQGIVEDRVKNAEGFDSYVTGGLVRPVYLSRTITPYVQFGYLFPLFCLILVAVQLTWMGVKPIIGL